MNYLEAAKLTATVESFLEALWKNHPKTMLGHGVRLGTDGRPEVFVTFLQPIEIPVEVNGVRIVSEVRPPAYLAGGGTEHKLDVFHCTDCKFEFAIVGLNKKHLPDDTPCPECGDNSNVSTIDCLDFRLIEKTQQFELVKGMKPLPK